MNKFKILNLLLFVTVLFCFSAFTQPPLTVEEIIARSVKAHGGDALSNWKTMVIKGEGQYPDVGKMFRTEHIVYAEKPGKVRVERDLTKFEHGRLFYTFFYNNGVGWSQASLMPRYGAQFVSFKRYLDQCDGIAYYAENAAFTQKPDEELNGKPVYVIDAVIKSDTTSLYIDKTSFYFLQEKYKSRNNTITRTFSDFKKFGKVNFSTTIVETSTSRRGEMVLNYKLNTIEYNVPIESWLFEEDMPKSDKK